MRPASALVLVLSIALCACGASQRTSTTSSVPALEQPAVDLADGVHVFESVPRGFHTRSYWIEGPDGIVVIDTQFMPSEARRLLDAIARESELPVRLAIVLHSNPDKFNGTPVFRERGIPVVSSAQVISHVTHVHEIRTRAFRDRYAPDWPDAPPEIDAFGDASRTLEVAGLSLGLHVMGRGCSDAHVVVTHGSHAFVGDLVAPGGHAWLELGHLADWHARLDEITALSPSRIHPGRGTSEGAESLAAQHAYLTRVESIVRDAQTARGEVTSPPTEAELDAVRGQVEAAFPGYAYPVFLRIGASAVWASVAAQ